MYITKSLIFKCAAGVFAAVIAAGLICSDKMTYEPKSENHSVYAADQFILSQHEVTLGKGESMRLYTNKNVVFVSSDTDIISVTEDGIVTANNTGKAYITARSENAEQVCSIEVKNEPDNVDVNIKDITVGIGETLIINAIIPENTASYEKTFFTGDKSIVEYNSDINQFKAISDGKTKIGITLYNGKTAECNVTVLKAPEYVSLSVNNIIMSVGENIKLNAITPEGCGGKITFSCNNEKIIKNDDSGNITALDKGEATITVTTYNGKTDKCRIIIKDEPEDFELSKKEINLREGKRTTLRVKLPEGTASYGMKFLTDDTDIINIKQSNETAIIEAVKEGKAIIKVKLHNGTEKSCNVTVTKGPVIEIIDGVTYMDGILIVNKSYPLPKNYGNGLDKKAESAFNKMAADALKDNISLRIVSGYRSYDTQAELYESYCIRSGQKEADRFSARPGHSEHQSGLAMDINSVYDSFAFTEEAKWLKDNCYKYGFIIRYPEDKEDITGYKYESWHIRYVGRELAEYLYKNNLTLEEYFGIKSEYQT